MPCLPMRIDKYLALQGIGSRREIHALLREGRVSVDGRTVCDAGLLLDPYAADVALDGDKLVYCDSMHLMMNKPAGVLTAAEDSRHRTVMDLLPRQMTSLNCMPIGRLDLDTEGLLLFTTDGKLAHRLLSPRHHVDKLYWAQVDRPLSEADVEAFAGGLRLSDFTALPALLEILPGDGRAAHVTMQEGKFHQVKRMFQARGRTVLHLKRLAFGGIWLDEGLSCGEWRRLTDREYATLTKAAEKN